MDSRAHKQPTEPDDGIERCRASIAKHSKSFALAARLLPPGSADSAAIVYAWCRRADDAVDHVPRSAQPAALAQLRAELEGVYAGVPAQDPALEAFRHIVEDCRVPRVYPEELLAGMQMDCSDARYATLEELLTYCYRVAGVVGLMMCHVMSVSDVKALRRAAHLGIAMQLTNICRDVLEDWELGRLYVPAELLAEYGAPDLRSQLGKPFPGQARRPMALAVERLLREADRYYASGDRGLAALSWRSALAVRSARHIYAAIGRRVEAQACDVTAGRAIVPLRSKLALVARSACAALSELPRRARSRFEPAVLDPAHGGPVVRFPQDILPV